MQVKSYDPRWQSQHLMKSCACGDRGTLQRTSTELLKAWKKNHVPKTQRAGESALGPVRPKLQTSAEAL